MPRTPTPSSPSPPPPPAIGRRHPPAAPRWAAAPTPGPARVARWRAELVRLRGCTPHDRPDYVAHLAAAGRWLGDVDWTRAPDAQVIDRVLKGEPPEPPRGDAEEAALDETILRALARRRRKQDAAAEAAPTAPTAAETAGTLR